MLLCRQYFNRRSFFIGGITTVTISSLFKLFKKKLVTRQKKYPEYPNIRDEYIDALKWLQKNKVNRRFLTRGKC